MVVVKDDEGRVFNIDERDITFNSPEGRLKCSCGCFDFNIYHDRGNWYGLCNSCRCVYLISSSVMV
jgi:hypothetical protein